MAVQLRANVCTLLNAQVYMQPSGTLGLLGLQSQQFFLRQVLADSKAAAAPRPLTLLPAFTYVP